MPKRGQVTVFIIIGIIILGIIAGVLYLQKTTFSESLEKPSFDEASAVKLYVESCLDTVSEEALRLVGRQGGYTSFENDVLVTNFIPTIPYINETQGLLLLEQRYPIPYYYYESSIHAPSKERVQQQIEHYVEKHLPQCTHHFASFAQEGIEVKEGTPSAVVSFLGHNVKINVKYPLTVILHDRSQTELTSFSIEKDIDMNVVLQAVSEILQLQERRGNAVLIADMAQVAQQHSFTYDIDYIAQDTVVYFLSFNRPVTDKKYIFAYAAQYDWGDELKVNDEYLLTWQREVSEEVTK